MTGSLSIEPFDPGYRGCDVLYGRGRIDDQRSTLPNLEPDAAYRSNALGSPRVGP